MRNAQWGAWNVRPQKVSLHVGQREPGEYAERELSRRQNQPAEREETCVQTGGWWVGLTLENRALWRTGGLGSPEWGSGIVGHLQASQ